MLLVHGFLSVPSRNDYNLQAAIESCMRIMMDISESHKDRLHDEDIASVPLTCVYILQETLALHQQQANDCGALACKQREREPLRAFLRALRNRWAPTA